MNNTTEITNGHKYKLHIGKLSLTFLYGFVIMFFVFRPQSISGVIMLAIYVCMCQIATFISFFFKIEFIDEKDIVLLMPACLSLSMFAIFCLQYPVQIAIANILAMASTQLAIMVFCFHRQEMLEGQ